MIIKTNIRKLRIIAFLLFLIPAFTLLGSLVAHNLLVSFKFNPGGLYYLEFHNEFENNLPGSEIKVLCNEKNNYCLNFGLSFAKSSIYTAGNKLNECNEFQLDAFFTSENGKITSLKIKKEEWAKNPEQQIFLNLKISDRLNHTCILNSDLIKYYNFVPFIFDGIFNLKMSKNFSLGASEVVNPIIYGETSISNIVKRFPIKVIFKPLMYLSVFLMIGYWVYYNLVLNSLLNKKNKNIFLVFGILSAFFLLLHVFFLGWTFESEIFTKIRRTYVIFFIFFEVLAQAFLIKQIFKSKSEISEYVYNIIVYSILCFVFLVCFLTIIILFILIFYDLEKKIDYILEWNYFLLLLIFYFLSFIMWKKNN